MLLPQPKTGTSQGLFVSPNNIRYLSSNLHSSVTIRDNSIDFASGSASDRLLEIPISLPGTFDQHSTIHVTVGLDASGPNTRDYNPRFGITDGTKVNRMGINDAAFDYKTSRTVKSCGLVDGTDENNYITPGTPAPAEYVFIFTPFYKYGACKTAQNGGYVNVGTFNTQLDLNKGMTFHVDRDIHGAEYYRYYYFHIEVINS